MFRVMLCCTFVFGLSGCSVSNPIDQTRQSFDQLEQIAAAGFRDSNASAGSSKAASVAGMPVEAGRIARVLQTQFGDGIRQQIVLDDPVPGLDPNVIEVRVRTSEKPALEDSLAITRPTEAGIRAELASQFPRMTMGVVDRPRSNAYGPYGLAIGRWANGVRCVYAWQWIDELKSARAPRGSSQVSVRVRLCRKDRSLDQIAGFLDRLELDLSRPNETAAPVAAVARSIPDEGAPAQIVLHESERPRPARIAAAKPARRVAEVAASTPNIVLTPEPAPGARETPLDRSLPAAAYRGPAPASIVTSIAKSGSTQ